MNFDKGHAGACNVYFGGACNCSVARAEKLAEELARALARIKELEAMDAGSAPVLEKDRSGQNDRT